MQPDPAPAAPDDETPWALARRLAAEGVAPAAIAERLRARGLSEDELATVFGAVGLAPPERTPGTIEAEPEPEEPGGPLDFRALVAAAMIAGGVLLFFASRGRLLAIVLVVGGIARLVAASRTGAERAARPEPRVLGPDEPGARCHAHPDHAAVGSCPRCGLFACERCVPAGGFGASVFCGPCERQPAMQAQRLRRSARLVAAGVFAQAGAWLADIAAGADLGLAEVVVALVLAMPFLLLGAVQLLVRHPWPGITGSVLTLGLVMWIMEASDRPAPLFELLFLLLPAAVTMFLVERLMSRRKAQRAHAAAVAR